MNFMCKRLLWRWTLFRNIIFRWRSFFLFFWGFLGCFFLLLHRFFLFLSFFLLLRFNFLRLFYRNGFPFFWLLIICCIIRSSIIRRFRLSSYRCSHKKIQIHHFISWRNGNSSINKFLQLNLVKMDE